MKTSFVILILQFVTLVLTFDIALHTRSKDTIYLVEQESYFRLQLKPTPGKLEEVMMAMNETFNSIKKTPLTVPDTLTDTLTSCFDDTTRVLQT